MSDNSNVTVSGGLLIQIILLIIHYGNIIRLPLWLVWLPLLLEIIEVLIALGILALVCIFVLFVGIISVIFGK